MNYTLTKQQFGKNQEKKEEWIIKEHKTLSTGKAAIYCLPGVGFAAMLAIAVNFTLVFYTHIMGQIGIIIGLIYSIALYIFALMCVVWGAIVDNIGKRKLMWISCVLLVVSFAFIWCPPIPTDSTPFGTIFLPVVLWFTAFSLLFRISGAAYHSSIYSLLPELTTDEKNRVKVSMINVFMMTLGTIIGMVGSILIMGSATQSLERNNSNLYYPESSTGQTIYAQIFWSSMCICAFFLIAFVLMQVSIRIPPKNKNKKTSTIEVLRNLADVFNNSNYRKWLIANFFIWIPFVAFQYLLLNAATFLFQLRGKDFLSLIFIAVFSVIASFVIWQKLSILFGVKNTLVACLVFSSLIFFIISFLANTSITAISPVLGIGLTTLLLCGLVGAMSFPLTIMSNLIDEAEAERRKKLSGSYSGAFATVQSFASATAMVIISVCFQMFGTNDKTSYYVIFSVSSFLLLIAVVFFQRVSILETIQIKKKDCDRIRGKKKKKIKIKKTRYSIREEVCKNCAFFKKNPPMWCLNYNIPVTSSHTCNKGWKPKKYEFITLDLNLPS